MAIGIIGGSSFLTASIFGELEFCPTETRYGTAAVYKGRNFFFIQRHGEKKDMLPHLINHKAHVSALESLGVKECIGIYSTGSLKKVIPPGSVVVPHDYIDLGSPATFHEGPIEDLNKAFTLPAIDDDLRKTLLYAANNSSIDVFTKGIYFQVRGPRLETPAEISLFSSFADIIGMNLAHEAILCQEAGLRFAALCSVDNYGNGIGERIDFRRIAEVKEKTCYDLSLIMKEVLK